MPELVKLYIRNVIIGFGISAVFVAALLYFDVMGLWALVSGSKDGVLAVFILWVMNGIVFASVQFGWAVMALAQKDNDGPRGGTPAAFEFRPIPVVNEARGGRERQMRRR
jgi:hypothetical protein